MRNTSVVTVVVLVFTVLLLMLNIGKARGVAIYPVRHGESTTLKAQNQSGSVAPRNVHINRLGFALNFCDEDISEFTATFLSASHRIMQTSTLSQHVEVPSPSDGTNVVHFRVSIWGRYYSFFEFPKLSCGNITMEVTENHNYLKLTFNGDILPNSVVTFGPVTDRTETYVRFRTLYCGEVPCSHFSSSVSNEVSSTTPVPASTPSVAPTMSDTTTVRPTKVPEPTTSAVMTTATPMETQTGKENAPNLGEGCTSKPLGAISGNDILNPSQGKDNVEKDSVNPQFYDDYSIRAKFPKSNTGEGKTVTYDISNVAGVGCVEIVYYVYTAGDISLKVDNHQSPVTNFGDQPTVADWTRRTAYYTRTGDSIKSLSITVKTPLWGDWTVQLAQISLFVGHTRIPPNFNLGCHLTMLSSIYGNALLAPQKGAMNVAEDRSNPSLFDNYPLRVKFPKSTSATGASVTYVVPLFSPSEDASCVEIVYYVYKGDGKMLFSVNDDTNHIDAVPFGDSSSQGGWERKTVYYKVPLNGASITSLSLNVKAKYVDLDWGVQLAAVTFFTGS